MALNKFDCVVIVEDKNRPPHLGPETLCELSEIIDQLTREPGTWDVEVVTPGFGSNNVGLIIRRPTGY